MWLSWNVAAYWALGLTAFVVIVPDARPRWLSVVGPTARELVLVLSLYSIWRLGHRLTVRKVHGAEDHARWVWHAERVLHLPSELTLQHAVLRHPLWAQALNGYYATFHGPALMFALVWLFARHREHYRAIRNCVFLVTGACLVLHIFPVAPPRLLPDLGFVDTGLVYGQSVYGPGNAGGLSNQLAAMPSVHVAWALIVGLAALRASTSRWRWIAVAHVVLTVLAVTATGNHWWLDGVAAAALLGLAVIITNQLRPPETLGSEPIRVLGRAT